jgi:hypothetical protein
MVISDLRTSRWAAYFISDSPIARSPNALSLFSDCPYLRHGSVPAHGAQTPINTGDVAIGYMTPKTLFVNLDRIAGEHRLMARAAARFVRCALGGQAIDPTAMAADYLADCTHVPVRTHLIVELMERASEAVPDVSAPTSARTLGNTT